MTQTFSVNSNNDLYLNREGNIAIVYGIEAILQNCEHAVKTRLGEVVLNINEGLPYFETVFNGVPNIMQFEAAARSTIRGVPGVVEVVSFAAVATGGILQYNAVIRTIFGAGIITNAEL